MVSETDEAAGLTPGNEENEADRCFSPEKPCLPLSTDGIIYQRKRGSKPASPLQQGETPFALLKC